MWPAILIAIGGSLLIIGLIWGATTWKSSAVSNKSAASGTAQAPHALVKHDLHVTPTPQVAPARVPEVSLRFVSPEYPALQLINRSDVVAKDIKYTVVLWDIDNDTQVNPLAIPIATFDFIKAKQAGGPQNIFGPVEHLLKPGTRLFGSASVNCPDCRRGFTYWVYIDWTHGGWFAEVPDETGGDLLIPSHLTRPELAAYFRDAQASVPEDRRIPILDLIPSPVAIGGKGGSGEIFGNGTVVGGAGGHVGAGGTGRGGDGGGGVIHGDGIIIGGEGGSVDGTDIWYPPAQSAYIKYLEDQGQTPDFGIQYPGAGGATEGWIQRQQVVTEIREKYFKDMRQADKLKSSKIGDVPLDYVNNALANVGYPWRARIDKKYWYLFYIPRGTH